MFVDFNDNQESESKTQVVSETPPLSHTKQLAEYGDPEGEGMRNMAYMPQCSPAQKWSRS